MKVTNTITATVIMRGNAPRSWWRRVVEVVPEPFYPPVVYPPVVYPRPWRYYPGPTCGVYYNGPGLSIGVGF